MLLLSSEEMIQWEDRSPRPVFLSALWDSMQQPFVRQKDEDGRLQSDSS